MEVPRTVGVDFCWNQLYVLLVLAMSFATSLLHVVVMGDVFATTGEHFCYDR